MSNYIKYIFFFVKQSPKWIFSKKEYFVKYAGQTFIFMPRSVDPLTYFENFVREEYNTGTNTTKKIMVDIGANIGLFSLWAVKKFNPDRIFAIEMDSDNCKRLLSIIAVNNLQKRISVINKAFFNKKTKLAEDLSTTFFNSCHRLNDKKVGNVETTTLKEILHLVGEKKIDFLKMDIEGSEKYLFSDENSKLLKESVREVAIEAHPQYECSAKDIQGFLDRSGFKTFCKKYFNPVMPKLLSEIVMGVNKKLL